MKKSFSEIIYESMHGKRRPVKKSVYVPGKWVRDKRGRFSGKRLRKSFYRDLKDYTRWTTGMEMLAENIAHNNTILQRLKGKA